MEFCVAKGFFDENDYLQEMDFSCIDADFREPIDRIFTFCNVVSYLSILSEYKALNFVH